MSDYFTYEAREDRRQKRDMVKLLCEMLLNIQEAIDNW